MPKLNKSALKRIYTDIQIEKNCTKEDAIKFWEGLSGRYKKPYIWKMKAAKAA